MKAPFHFNINKASDQELSTWDLIIYGTPIATAIFSFLVWWFFRLFLGGTDIWTSIILSTSMTVFTFSSIENAKRGDRWSMSRIFLIPYNLLVGLCIVFQPIVWAGFVTKQQLHQFVLNLFS